MKIQYLSRLQELLKRPVEKEEIVAFCKTAKAITRTISIASLTLVAQDCHKGQYLKAFTWLPISLLAYELTAILNNLHKAFSNPLKRIRFAHVICTSEEASWRYTTRGAPLTRMIGLLYLHATRQKSHFFSIGSFSSRIYNNR